MANYHLSKDADQDLAEIYEYSILNFGLMTAREYYAGLIQTFENLCDNLHIGRLRSEIRPDLRSITYHNHVVFYRVAHDEIIILRVLHGSRDVKEI